MDWIFDHLQIVVIAIVVVGSIIKQFLDAKAAERQARKDMEERGDVFGPEEYWETDPPAEPPPLTGSVPPPLRRQTEPVAVDESMLRRQHEMQERLKQIKETKAITTGNAAVTRTRAANLRKPAKPVEAGPATLRSTLRGKKEIRRAIILKEILDKPLGLR